MGVVAAVFSRAVGRRNRAMTPPPRACAVLSLLLVSCGVRFAAAQTASGAPPSPDWLRYVPADTRLYVELRDLDGIRRAFLQLGIWDVVRELSEPVEAPATSRPWHRSAERALGLTPETAITWILGRRAALIAADVDDWQAGILLAELPRGSRLATLLRRWSARTMSPIGPVRRYRLRGGIVLAALDRTVLFGPPGDPTGLWGRTVDLLAGRGGPTLAEKSEFAGLASRLRTDRSGMAYLSRPHRDGSDSGSDRRSDRLLLGFSITPKGMTCEVHGQRTVESAVAAPQGCLPLESLPASTMGCWTSSFDFGDVDAKARRGRDGLDVSLVNLFLRFMMSLDEGAAGKADVLGPRFAVVLASDGPDAEAPFIMPRVSLILQARDADALAERLAPMVQLFATMFAGASGEAPATGRPATIGSEQLEDVVLRHVDLGTVLASRPEYAFLTGAEFCWASLDGNILLSSSRPHLRSIIRAAHRGNERPSEGVAPALSVALSGHERPVVEWGFARGRAVSEMLQSWLAFARQAHPDALRPAWWRAWAGDRLARRSRLGLGLKDDPAGPRRALVAEIALSSPATGLLRIGDVVVEAAGNRLPAERPARAVADRYARRGAARTFELRIIRRGRRLAIAIPVPADSGVDLAAFNPPRVVRQLSALLRPVDSVAAWRLDSAPGGLHAVFEVRWHRATRGPRMRPPAPNRKKLPRG